MRWASLVKNWVNLVKLEKGMRRIWDLVSVEGDGDETRSALGDKGGEGPKAGLWATSSPLQISESPRHSKLIAQGPPFPQNKDSWTGPFNIAGSFLPKWLDFALGLFAHKDALVWETTIAFWGTGLSLHATLYGFVDQPDSTNQGVFG